jgi:hypothetical protein
MSTDFRSRRVHLSLMFAVAIAIYPAGPRAEETTDDVIKATPIFFALPIELEFDAGATSGDASILRFMPLYSFPSFTKWKLVNINLLTLADAPGGIPGQPGNPEPIAGDQIVGVSDLLHASFYTPRRSGNLIWGLGGALMIPTASDGRLGSGKWSAGPAFRLTYRAGPWTLGAFGAQSWSFAGDADRKDVSQFMMRGTFRRQLPNKWYFVSAPVVTANWNAAGEKWLVPVGGGFGKVFDVGSYPWALSVQGYYNAIKPIGAPDWTVRLSVIAAIKLGNE